MAEHTVPATPTSTLTLQIPDLQATAQLAVVIAACLTPGFRLYLSGNLGCGKTEFTRALLRALGHQGRVKSPSYALVEPYNLSRFDLYHFDFYRLTDTNAWRDAGFEEMLQGDAVSVLEWPEMAAGLPLPDLWLQFELATAQSETARRLQLTQYSSRGLLCLESLRGAGFYTEP